MSIIRTEEDYNRAIDRAWRWHIREIAYKPTQTHCELVLLKGHYEGKKAIKIPARMDTRDYKQFLEKELEISIRKYIFSSDFTITHDPQKFRIYLYMTRKEIEDKEKEKGKEN
jgi:hypothetical protein